MKPFIVAALVALVGGLACVGEPAQAGAPAPAPTQTPWIVEVTQPPQPPQTPWIVEVTQPPQPTYTPHPIPSPEIILATRPATTPPPTQTPHIIENVVNNIVTVVVTATPRPTLRPTYGFFRPAVRPPDAGHRNFQYVKEPVLDGTVLRLEANTELRPTQLQVYHSLRGDDLDRKCTTLRPIAFVEEGQGGGVTDVRWMFCPSPSTRPKQEVSRVPWLTAAVWTLQESEGVWTWTAAVDLDDERVADFLYDDKLEHLVVVAFAEHVLLTRRWVGP